MSIMFIREQRKNKYNYDELTKSQKLTAKRAREVAKNAIPSSINLCEHCG